MNTLDKLLKSGLIFNRELFDTEDWIGGAAAPPILPCAGAGACCGAVASLPSLYYNNVIENDARSSKDGVSQKTKALSEKWIKTPKKGQRACGDFRSYDKKCAASLFDNASVLLSRGVENCVFVTITTPENLSYWTMEGWQEARKRFRSWTGNKGGLAYVFGEGRDWLRVIEPQRRGAIHWHMLIHTDFDVRSGIDFEAFERRDYRSSSASLRGMWLRMRQSAKRYKFGRVEIMPVKSDKWEAAARYVGKYISKSVNMETFAKCTDGKNRPAHTRRVGFSSGWRVSNSQFSWAENGREWRKAVGIFARAVGVESFEELQDLLGKKWMWNNRKILREIAEGDFKLPRNLPIKTDYFSPLKMGLPQASKIRV